MIFFILRLNQLLYRNVRRTFFGEILFFLVCFSGFASSLLKYKKFFKLCTRKFHFPKHKRLFKSRISYFLSSESSYLKYKKNMRLQSSISGNRRNFFEVDFFYFFELGLKSGPGSPITHYSR